MAASEIFPYAVWLQGTNQNSIPANDNSLRTEVVQRAAEGIANSAPSTPTEGDLHIVGTAWGGFSPDDVVIYKGGTWLAFAPFDGWIKRDNSSGDVLVYEAGAGWNVFSSGGGGGDLLSPLSAAEVSVTAAATLSVGRMHACSGTSADYAITLPAASGNAGKFVGVRMAPGLTRWVTLTGDGSELIDGSNTRRMWRNEAAILLCDGTRWTKVAGKTVPMACSMNRPTTDSAFSIDPSDFIAVPMTTVCADNTAGMAVTMADTGNGRARTLRTGRYSCAAMISLVAPSGTTLAALCTKDSAVPDGAPSIIQNGYIAGLGVGQTQAAGVLNVTALGYITAAAFQDNASARQTRVDFYGVVPSLSVTELPDW